MFSIHGFAGTNVSPSEKMALPERALHVPYGKMTSPERDKPRSLRKDGFAGTGQAPSLQKAFHCE